MEEKNIALRQVATKIAIREFLEGTFLQEDSESAPGLILPSNQRVFRLNVMGVVLDKEKIGNITTFLIDDGSGKVAVRFFEDTPAASALARGEALLLIGKPRKYNQEKYISPEIIKKISPPWLKLRAAELAGRLGLTQKRGASLENKSDNEKGNASFSLEVVEETVGEETIPSKKVVQLIRSLDSGGGVRIEEILEKSPLGETEKILKKMLESGEIFQVLPGRVKVL